MNALVKQPVYAKNNTKIIVWFLCIVACLASPLLAFAVITLTIFATKPLNAKILLLPLIVNLSVWLSLINSTKLPESDLLVYLDHYNALRGLSLIDLIEAQQHEILFHLFSWIAINYLLLSDAGYVFLLSNLFYLTLLIALYKYGDQRQESIFKIIGVIFFLALFPPLFSISAHIIRQVIAGAIATLALVNTTKTARSNLLLLSVATLFHTSAAVFFLAPLSLAISRIIGRSSALVALTLIPAFILIIRVTAEFALDFPIFAKFLILQYGLQRISQTTFFELNSLSSSALFFTGAIAILAAWIMLKNDRAHNAIENSRLLPSSFTFILCVFVFLFHHLNLNELAIRFIYYAYILMGLLLLDMPISKHLPAKGGSILLATTFFIIFLVTINLNGWSYENPIETTVKPLLMQSFFRGVS